MLYVVLEPRGLHDSVVYLPAVRLITHSDTNRTINALLSPGHTALSTPPLVHTPTPYHMGQSPSSQPSAAVLDPPKSDFRVIDPPKLDFRVADPPAHPPSGLALIAHGRGATIDCPVVAALATCLREKHGCRTVTWSARRSGGTTRSHKDREDYNVSSSANVPVFCNKESKLTGVTLFWDWF
jgi:hypothetical protein